MYKIDRRGGVQKSYTRTDPINKIAGTNFSEYKFNNYT